MTILEKDIKKLWGLAAARCSFPECINNCIDFLDEEDPTILGEMAHVIAKKPEGPRGVPEGGDDSYINLILLCPYHHRLVDKAPNKFPVELLYSWKEQHESKVKKSLSAPEFKSKKLLFTYISKLLIENKSIWNTFGPESVEAQKNPYSNNANFWIIKKLSTIVPNNRRIINAIQSNSKLISTNEYQISVQFITHAEAFESNCYFRIEGVPRFPNNFEEMIYG